MRAGGHEELELCDTTWYHVKPLYGRTQEAVFRRIEKSQGNLKKRNPLELRRLTVIEYIS